VDRIVQFCLQKLQSKPNEWRRVLKTLNCIEFVIKNGSPQIVVNFKSEMYKLNSLTSFYFQENGKDQGVFIRDKAALVTDLLTTEAKLMHERSEAFEYRKKFYPGTGPTAQ
jgi:epsin